MKFNLLSLSESIAALGFILLFPTFFLYHYLVYNNVIPPFLGGLFGLVSLIIGIISILFIPWIIINKLGSQIISGIFFYFICIYYLLFASISYIFFDSSSNGIYAFNETFSTIIIWLGMFFIGFFIKINSTRFKIAIQISWFVSLFLFLHSIILKGSFFGLFLIFQSNDDFTILSSYQQIGRAILLTTLFYITSFNNNYKLLLVYIISFIMLFSVGSRTEFLSLAFVFILKYVIPNKKTTINFNIIPLILLCFILFYFSNSIFRGSRFSEILDLASSTSWQSRSELTLLAIDIILKNPISGDFAYYINAGGYAHNILSSWASFGLFGFLFFSFSLLYYFVITFKNYFFTSNRFKAWELAFHLNSIIILQAIFTTPIFSVLPALAWGLVFNNLKKSN
jgi:hypothetical protein